MKTTTINIKKANENAKIPTRGSEYAAGYDLYACIDKEVTIEPHKSALIDTGLSVELPEGAFGGIFARSGLATKKGLAPANKVGVVDSDYRGSVMIALHNHSDKVQNVSPGERIAQLIVIPYIPIKFNEVNELSDTERGSGGFGSTGSN